MYDRCQGEKERERVQEREEGTESLTNEKELIVILDKHLHEFVGVFAVFEKDIHVHALGRGAEE